VISGASGGNMNADGTAGTGFGQASAENLNEGRTLQYTLKLTF